MSAHPHRQQFEENIVGITAPPVFVAPTTPSIATDIDLFNKQNDPSLEGYFIATNSRLDNNAGGENENKREKEKQYFSRSIVAINNQDMAAKASMDKISMSSERLSSGLKLYKNDMLSSHDAAARNVSVTRDEVAINPKTGQPLTRAEQNIIDQQTSSCSFKLVAEDLVRDEQGNFVMDATKTNFYNADMQARMETTLQQAQETESLIEKAQSGEIEFKELPQHVQIPILQAMPVDEKKELFEKSGLNADEIANLETLTRADPTGILTALENPNTANARLVINEGKVIPGGLSNAYLDATTNAPSMTPDTGTTYTPSASFAPQFKIQIPAFGG